MAYLWFLGSVRDYLGGRGAASLAGTASVGGVFAITLLLLGLLMVGSAVALFVDHGILQFGGVVDIVGGIPALLWIAALSVVMVLDTRAGAVAAGPAAC